MGLMSPYNTGLDIISKYTLSLPMSSL